MNEGPARQIAPGWVWWPAIAYMMLIAVVSSFAIQVTDVAPRFLDDKSIHFLEYALLGFLCAHASIQTWPGRSVARMCLLGALIATAFGLSDEIHQAFVPGRAADVYDFLADACGALAGAFVRFWRSKGERHRGERYRGERHRGERYRGEQR